MRTRFASVGAFAASAAVALAAFGQEAGKTEPRKVELVYRWDQLDGKKAVYDTEVVTSRLDEAHTITTGVEDGADSETAPAKVETRTTTKQRKAFAFKAGERGRGLVTVTTESAKFDCVLKTGEGTETFAYDTQSPPKEVPEKFKPFVAALLGNPFTLTVSRRGAVEKVDGIKDAKLADFKGLFLVLPESAAAEGESWNDVRRHPADRFGDIVERVTLKLAKVTEKDERRIDEEIKTELDETKSDLPEGVIAKIEKPVGKGHVTLDARGLKLDEETEQGYEFYMKQVSDLRQIGGTERRTTVLSTFRWKLVEVKDAK